MISHNNKTEKKRLFVGFDRPFLKKPWLSPLTGILQRLVIKNLRMHGHYDLRKSEFKRPEGLRVPSPYYPQDAMASMLERLFPSSVGLVANSSLEDPIPKYLTPQRIAKIIITLLSEKVTVESLAKTKRICYYKKNPNDKDKDAIEIKLASLAEEIFHIIIAVSPDILRNIKNNSKASKNPAIKTIKPEYVKSVQDAAEFSTLLLQAFYEQCGTQSGYPNNIFITALLVYMMEKNKHNEVQIKLYIDEMVNAKYADKIKTLESCEQETVTDLERQVIAKSCADDLAYLPELLEFGISQYELKERHKSNKDSKKEFRTFSNCGETLLLNLFIQWLYSPVTKKIEVERLHEIAKAGYPVSKPLLDFFTYVCNDVDSLYKADTILQWNYVVGYLNEGNSDCEYKVRYMHPDPQDGYVGLDAGINNIIMVLITILGLNKQAGEFGLFDLRQCTYTKYDCLLTFERIFVIFNKVSERVAKNKIAFYQNECVSHMFLEGSDSIQALTLFDLSDRLYGESWHGFSIRLFYPELAGQRAEYKISFDHNHFDMVQVSEEGAKEMVNQVIHVDELHEIYQLKMDNSYNRIMVLEKILAYQQKYGTSSFQYLLKKWLEPNGYYFDGWRENVYVEYIAKLLLKFVSKKELTQFINIPEIVSEFVWHYAKEGDVASVREWFDADVSISRLASNDVEKGLFAKFLNKSLRKCDDAVLSTLIKADAQKYLREVTYYTLPQCLAALGETPLEQPLSAYGIDVNESRNGYSPIYYAIKFNSLSMLQSLVDQGACLIEVNPEFDSALDFVLQLFSSLKLQMGVKFEYLNNHEEQSFYFKLLNMLELLLSRGCDINRSKQIPDAVLSNLTANHEIHKLHFKDDDIDNNTPVFDTIVDLINLYVVVTTEKEVISIYRKNVMFHHVMYGRIPPDNQFINEKNRSQQTMLMVAAANGHASVLVELLRCGADVSVCDAKQRNALYYAIGSRKIECTRLLIEAGIDINHSDQFGLTPIQHAFKSRDIDGIHLLVQKQVRHCNPDENGYTLLHFAVMNGSLELIASLIEQGIDINAPANDGTTALHIVCKNGYEPAVSLLLAANANLNVYTCRGEGPLDLAQRSCHRCIVLLLQMKNLSDAIRDLESKSKVQLFKHYTPTNLRLKSALLAIYDYLYLCYANLKNNAIVTEDEINAARKKVLTYNELIQQSLLLSSICLNAGIKYLDNEQPASTKVKRV